MYSRLDYVIENDTGRFAINFRKERSFNRQCSNSDNEKRRRETERRAKQTNGRAHLACIDDDGFVSLKK